MLPFPCFICSRPFLKSCEVQIMCFLPQKCQKIKASHNLMSYLFCIIHYNTSFQVSFAYHLYFSRFTQNYRKSLTSRRTHCWNWGKTVCPDKLVWGHIIKTSLNAKYNYNFWPKISWQCFHFISSPGPKGHVSLCRTAASVVHQLFLLGGFFWRTGGSRFRIFDQ